MVNIKKPFGTDESISAVTARLFGLILKMPIEDRKALLNELETKISGKQRKHPRRDSLMDVHFTVDKSLYVGYIRNISPGGVFIETRMEPLKGITSGDPIVLTFHHPDTGEPLKVRGEIARIDQTGFGVKFENLIPLFA